MYLHDFDTLLCNCNARSKVNGRCPYNSLFRHSIVVYKATCEKMAIMYIGNTQQKLKSKMVQHYSETKDQVNKELMPDSSANHFAR